MNSAFKAWGLRLGLGVVTFPFVVRAAPGESSDSDVSDDSSDGASPETVDGLTEETEPVIERTPATAGNDFGIDAIPERANRSSNFQGRIRSEYTEVMAGPGAAYLGRGRVYQNDVVRIVRRNEGGDWLEIDSSGLRGWVRTRSVEIKRTATVSSAEGGVDAGRDRRESNYQYDQKGRRLRPDGRPVGTGEGAEQASGEAAGDAEAPAEEPTELNPPEASPGGRGGAPGQRLRPFGGLGYGEVRRLFDSNIEGDSPLKHQSAQPAGMALTLGLEWDPLVYLRLGLRLDGVFFGSTDVPANAALGFAKPVELDISGWQSALDAMGRYPLGPLWIGGYAGLRLLRENYQKTKQYPLFLTNTLWSGGVGAAVGGEWPVGLEVSARGGYTVPISLSQDPTNAGKLESGSGYEVGATLGWRLHPSVTATAELFFVRSKLEFQGASGQKQTSDAQTSTGVDALGYDRARETDTLQGLTLGVRGVL